MENEPTISSSFTPADSAKKQTPWGVLIAIVLILVIMVASAYHVLKERLTPQTTIDYSTQQ